MKTKITENECEHSMPDTHRHEWVTAKEGVLCGLVDCHARLTYAEIYQRLNAVEELWTENKRLREYVVHKRECFKNMALADLGVGGRLASCTCGLDN